MARRTFTLNTLIPGRRIVPPRRRAATRSYIICTNPRSGSWLLSDGLSSTARAGHPREWFNVNQERTIRSDWDARNRGRMAFTHYVRHILERGTTGNGVFGLKLHYYQLCLLVRNA